MDTKKDSTSALNDREERIARHEHALLEQYGPLVTGNDLLRVAGYRTAEALRMAIRRDVVGFDVFIVKGRRGRSANARNVAEWLVDLEDGKGRKKAKQMKSQKEVPTA